jgi:adenylate kinase
MKKIFLGAPGSGKGTAASRIAPKLNVPHISTGDLFRRNIKEETEIGTKAKEYMEKGDLVPDEIVIEMLKSRIEEADCSEGFILDGFPRTIPQAEKLAEISDMDVVINMNVPDEIIIKRLSSRITCKDCGEIFNLVGIPTKEEGICDKCQGEVIRRADDEPKVIQNRLETYREQTAPLIDFYKNKGVLQDVICNNFDQTADETAQQVLDSITNFAENITSGAKEAISNITESTNE